MAGFKITFGAAAVGAAPNPNAATIAGRILDVSTPAFKARKEAFERSIEPLVLDPSGTFASYATPPAGPVRINFATANSEMECIMPDGTKRKDWEKYIAIMLNACKNFTSVDINALQLPVAQITPPAVPGNFVVDLTARFNAAQTSVAAPLPAPVIAAYFRPRMSGTGFQISNVLGNVAYQDAIKTKLAHATGASGYKYRPADNTVVPALPNRLVKAAVAGNPERVVRIDDLGGFRGPETKLSGAGAPPLATPADLQREADKIYKDIMASVASVVAMDEQSNGSVPPEDARPYSIGTMGSHNATPPDNTTAKFNAISGLVTPRLIEDIRLLYPNHTGLFVIANYENGRKGPETTIPGPSPRP
ncbi:MAG TPA: hypothetical protein VGV92_08820 [Gammaproteobacteria bacterium]|nr:hypothetical protein [Gammaproteobacteria bacterium]